MSMLAVCRGLERRRVPKARRELRGIYTPKAGNKNFYKGYGARSTGRFLKHANYQLIENKIPEIIVPDLTNCELKPYVSYATPKVRVAPPKVPQLDMATAEVPINRAMNPKQWQRRQYALAAKKELEEKKAKKLVKRQKQFEKFMSGIRRARAAIRAAKEGKPADSTAPLETTLTDAATTKA